MSRWQPGMTVCIACLRKTWWTGEDGLCWKCTEDPEADSQGRKNQ